MASLFSRPPVKPGTMPVPDFGDALYSLMSPGADPIPRDPTDPPPPDGSVIPPPVNSAAPGGDPTETTPPLGKDKAPPWLDPTKPGSQVNPQTPWKNPNGSAVQSPQFPNVPGAGGSVVDRTSASSIANQSAFGGFNFGRAQDPLKSTKDSFARAASAGAQDDRWKNSATSAAWFDQYVRPGLEADGHEVLEVKGDKAFIRTIENPEGTWIDWVQNIDGANPMLAWQDQSYMDDPAAGGGGAPGASGGGDPTGGTTIDDGGVGIPSGGGSNDDYIRKMIAELAKLVQGDPADLLGGAINSQLSSGGKRLT